MVFAGVDVRVTRTACGGRSSESFSAHRTARNSTARQGSALESNAEGALETGRLPSGDSHSQQSRGTQSRAFHCNAMKLNAASVLAIGRSPSRVHRLKATQSVEPRGIETRIAPSQEGVFRVFMAWCNARHRIARNRSASQTNATHRNQTRPAHSPEWVVRVGYRLRDVHCDVQHRYSRQGKSELRGMPASSRVFRAVLAQGIARY